MEYPNSCECNSQSSGEEDNSFKGKLNRVVKEHKILMICMGIYCTIKIIDYITLLNGTHCYG